MELYKAEAGSVSLMMLGCDMASQQTYLNMLAGGHNQNNITDFVVKKVVMEDD